MRPEFRLWILGLLLIAGCVRVEHGPEEPWRKTTLMIVRSRDGVTLQWQSVKDQRYTILYSDPTQDAGRWQELPVGTQVVGTGGTMTIVDTAPTAAQRKYRSSTLVAVPSNKVRRY